MRSSDMNVPKVSILPEKFSWNPLLIRVVIWSILRKCLISLVNDWKQFTKKGTEAVQIITTKIITKHRCYHGEIREWLKWWQICVCSTEMKNSKSWFCACCLWDLVIFCKQVSGYLWGDHCPIFLLSSKKELPYSFLSK